MKTSKANLCLIYLVAMIVLVLACAGRPYAQTAVVESSNAKTGSATQWSLQVERIEPGEVELAYSFQVAAYENLLEELNKTHQFKQVFREGDRKATEASSVLVLRTTVVKYTAGSETRRAVTTVSGATKLSVRSKLMTRDGKVLLDRTVDGKVRLFGSNLRVTHNLARNIATAINQYHPGSEQSSPALASQASAASSHEEHQ